MIETAKRSYKATFLLDSRQVEVPVEELVARYEEVLKSLGAEVTASSSLGSHNLVRKARTGMSNAFMLEYEFTAGPEAAAALQEKVRLDRTVNRVVVQNG